MIHMTIDGVDVFESFSAIFVDETISVPPDPKISTVDVHGFAGGQVDLSDSSGNTCWNMRDGEIRLLFEGDELKIDIDAFVSAFNGRKCKLWFGNDARFYYDARISVSNIKRYIGDALVTLSAKANAFKTRPFSKVGVTGSFTNISIKGDSPMLPVVTVSGMTSYSYLQLLHTGIGKFIRVNSPSGTFSSQSISKVIIDFNERHCEFVKNNNTMINADPYVTLESDYFEWFGDMVLSVAPSYATYDIEGDELWL